MTGLYPILSGEQLESNASLLLLVEELKYGMSEETRK